MLLACAVRIAQFLCLHRLGPEPSENANTVEESPRATQQRLIEREISKRVWWFLVRQDWLQIPFNKTYNIDPTQFNTPMPKNCDEELSLMVSSNAVIDHDQEHYTQGSYTMVLNNGKFTHRCIIKGIFTNILKFIAVVVLIWKTQDRLCQQGQPNAVEGGLHRLYAEVIQADRELRELMDKMPAFFRNASGDHELPFELVFSRRRVNNCLMIKKYATWY
jgi:hypothetical protein